MVYFHSFACGCPVFPKLFIEETFLSPLYVLGSLVENQLSINVWVYFWAFDSIPLISVSAFVPVPCCFGYYSFVVYFEIRECDTSSFVLFSQDSSSNSGSFVVPHKFKDSLFYFCEKCCGNFGRDCIESIDCFRKYRHLNYVTSSNIRARNIFPFLCVFFNLFQQCFIVFDVQIFHLFG